MNKGLALNIRLDKLMLFQRSLKGTELYRDFILALGKVPEKSHRVLERVVRATRLIPILYKDLEKGNFSLFAVVYSGAQDKVLCIVTNGSDDYVFLSKVLEDSDTGYRYLLTEFGGVYLKDCIVINDKLGDSLIYGKSLTNKE